jgi:hypothetical protein
LSRGLVKADVGKAAARKEGAFEIPPPALAHRPRHAISLMDALRRSIETETPKKPAVGHSKAQPCSAAQAGVGPYLDFWHMLLAPAGTPRPIID